MLNARAATAAIPLCTRDRYAVYENIGAGGMATVHLGRLRRELGFGRTVAIKRLRPVYAHDPEFVSMFLDEARMASRVRHPNVVSTLDIVTDEGELLLVMDYVDGESLWRLMRMTRECREPIPHQVAAAIVSGVLQGLHAAHETMDERGNNFGLVHRDVSPHNVLVGRDGWARVLDFGIAHALERVHVSQIGTIKGKFGYMAPEQLQGSSVTRQADIYAASVLLWELLTGSCLFPGLRYRILVSEILDGRVPPPSRVAQGLPQGYDQVVLRGLAEKPADRYPSAHQMALELEACDGIASATAIAAWLERLAGDQLRAHADRVSRMERSSEPCKMEDLRESLDRMLASSDSIALEEEPQAVNVRASEALVTVVAPVEVSTRTGVDFGITVEPDPVNVRATEALVTVATPVEVSTRTGVNSGTTVKPPAHPLRHVSRGRIMLAIGGLVTCSLAMALGWWPRPESPLLGPVAASSGTSVEPPYAPEAPRGNPSVPSSSPVWEKKQDQVASQARGALSIPPDRQAKRGFAPRPRVTRASSGYAYIPGGP
jgi:serine/threonine protein kinase